jgi:hypothetical protein
MKLILDNLIENFIKDLDSKNIPNEIDIVLEGGAFNGTYELGIMMYIKKLEQMKKIKVRRISGTSVGAILGLAYILDELHLFNDISNKMLQFFKETYNFFKFRELLFDVCNNHMKPYDYKLFQNKFYLTYFDSNKKKQIIKKKYKNNEDLIRQVLKSTYIPFLMDGNLSYKGSIDGCYPYIFKKRENRKILYVTLTSLKYIKGIISVKNEQNGHMRVFDGILDINKFLNSNRSTDLCSYVDDWSLSDFIIVRSKELGLVLMLTILDVIIKIIKLIPNDIKDHKYSIWLKQIISTLFYDILSRIIN